MDKQQALFDILAKQRNDALNDAANYFSDNILITAENAQLREQINLLEAENKQYRNSSEELHKSK